MIFTTAQVQEMVNRGFRVLTREQRDRVNTAQLEMHNGWYCVLGQVFGWFGTGCDQLFPGTNHLYSMRAAEAHGFYVCKDEDISTNYAALEREWTRRLETEREITELLEPVGSF